MKKLLAVLALSLSFLTPAFATDAQLSPDGCLFVGSLVGSPLKDSEATEFYQGLEQFLAMQGVTKEFSDELADVIKLHKRLGTKEQDFDQLCLTKQGKVADLFGEKI